MLSSRYVELLFLTNFSDACFRATRAVAQLADEVELGLTLMYARDPEKESRQAAEDKLRSFFPEADRYRVCRRVVVDGDVLSAVTDLRARRRIDLVLAPVADRFRWPRIFHTSVRERLVTELGLNVWTIDRGIKPVKLGAKAKNVACVLDSGSGHDKHLQAAIAYANSLDATLHVLHVMHRADATTPLASSSLVGHSDIGESSARVVPKGRTDVHVAASGGTRELLRRIVACDADILFVNERRAVQTGVFSTGLSHLIEAAPCPTICVRVDEVQLSSARPRKSVALIS